MVYGINMARIQLWGVSAILKDLNKVKEMEKLVDIKHTKQYGSWLVGLWCDGYHWTTPTFTSFRRGGFLSKEFYRTLIY